MPDMLFLHDTLKVIIIIIIQTTLSISILYHMQPLTARYYPKWSLPGVLKETYSSTEVVLAGEIIKLTFSGYLAVVDRSETGELIH
jgi:hypothetical protein